MQTAAPASHAAVDELVHPMTLKKLRLAPFPASNAVEAVGAGSGVSSLLVID